jgi:hypothetical protein
MLRKYVLNLKMFHPIGKASVSTQKEGRADVESSGDKLSGQPTVGGYRLAAETVVDTRSPGQGYSGLLLRPSARTDAIPLKHGAIKACAITRE